MAITLKSAENALKSVYLDVVTEQLDNLSPFFSAIKKSTEFVNGKEARKLVAHGINGGIGAGTEEGELPTARGNSYIQLVTTLKNLYGTIEISDKAVRAASTDTGAFVNLLNAEMDGLIRSSTFNFSRMLFGDGSAKLGIIESVSVGNKLTIIDVENFYEGMYVEIRNRNGNIIPGEEQPRIVKSVDREKYHVILGGPELNAELIEPLFEVYLAGSYGNELTGLNRIFDLNKDELYGVKRSESGWLKPIVKTVTGSFSEETMQGVIDAIEANSGTTPNLIITSWDVRRVLLRLYREKGIRLESMTINGGFKAINFNGIPVVVDRFCPQATMYFVNTNDFELHQLCDWQWLEGEDGAVLKQVPGKPVYTATLVKYADLMCSRPNGQAKLIGVV